jgi:hypothetical protein
VTDVKPVATCSTTSNQRWKRKFSTRFEITCPLTRKILPIREFIQSSRVTDCSARWQTSQSCQTCRIMVATSHISNARRSCAKRGCVESSSEVLILWLRLMEPDQVIPADSHLPIKLSLPWM